MNVTYTGAEAAGLVPFLNQVARSPPSRTVLVNLPAGTVWRGNGALSISSGLSITLQGRGQDGAGNTTLDLQEQNLALGAMLGNAGRMEFNGMRITNVRALRCAALPALCGCAPRGVRDCCAQGSTVSLLTSIGSVRSALAQCRAGQGRAGLGWVGLRPGCPLVGVARRCGLVRSLFVDSLFVVLLFVVLLFVVLLFVVLLFVVCGL